jgi:hypothetical protein
MFDLIAMSIAQDLGGEAQLSTVQKHLVEAFAGAAIHTNNLTAKLLRGEEVDIVAHSQAISTMVRVAQRVGIHRVAKVIGSTSLGEKRAAEFEEQRREEQAKREREATALMVAAV